jgi:hypothetical protein
MIAVAAKRQSRLNEWGDYSEESLALVFKNDRKTSCHFQGSMQRLSNGSQ